MSERTLSYEKFAIKSTVSLLCLLCILETSELQALDKYYIIIAYVNCQISTSVVQKCLNVYTNKCSVYLSVLMINKYLSKDDDIKWQVE